MREGMTQLLTGAVIAALIVLTFWGPRTDTPALFGMPLYALAFLFGGCVMLFSIGRTVLSPPQGRDAMQSAVIFLLAPFGLLGALNGTWGRLIQVFAIVVAIAAVAAGLSLLLRRTRLGDAR